MARIRSIKPEFFDDPDVARLSPWARLLFIGLWTQADRAGRLHDEPLRIKARLFPFDDEASVQINVRLDELCTAGWIKRYTVDRKPYLWVVNFEKHQYPHPKEQPSVLPPCPVKPLRRATRTQAAADHGEPGKAAASREKPRQATGENMTCNAGSSGSSGSSDQGTGSPDRGTEQSVSSAPKSAPEPAGNDPPVLLFPTVGPGGPAWALTQPQVAEWQGLFPGLDVGAEARHALAWVQAAPDRRKTAGGMTRFLVGWFSRSVNNGRRAPPAGGNPKTAGNLAALQEFAARRRGGTDGR